MMYSLKRCPPPQNKNADSDICSFSSTGGYCCLHLRRRLAATWQLLSARQARAAPKYTEGGVPAPYPGEHSQSQNQALEMSSPEQGREHEQLLYTRIMVGNFEGRDVSWHNVYEMWA